MSIFSDLDSQGKISRDSLLFRFRLRWKRRRLILRALRRRRDLHRVNVDETAIQNADFIAFMTIRNEAGRLPYFLKHYRALGIQHFLIVDNSSTDESADILSAADDVSLWRTEASYKESRFGTDWLGCLQFKFGPGKWCLTVDADELLVTPENMDIPALCDRLEASGNHSFGTVMLDMYPKGRLSDAVYTPGDDPITAISWFDPNGYRAKRHDYFDNLWVQGGVRERVFFEKDPSKSPTLSKIPLVKWERGYVYVTSTHQMLPRYLNRVFEPDRPTGILLHTKFLPEIIEKSREEISRRQHFENSDLYKEYHNKILSDPILWHEGSVVYQNDEQLECLGLMSKGTSV